MAVGLVFLGSFVSAEETAEPAAPIADLSLTATTPEIPAIPAAPAAPEETVLLDDELPTGWSATGTWVWDVQAASGTKSHGHAAGGTGTQQHGATFTNPVFVPRNAEIVTSVWLDPANPPKGIMIKLKLENGDETGVYWEGEEEVFNPGEDEEIWYYGLLPEYGAWTPLSIVAEDLGIEDAKLTGITFATYGGRVLWDKTVVRQAEPLPDLLPPMDDAGSEPIIP